MQRTTWAPIILAFRSMISRKLRDESRVPAAHSFLTLGMIKKRRILNASSRILMESSLISQRRAGWARPVSREGGRDDQGKKDRTRNIRDTRPGKGCCV